MSAIEVGNIENAQAISPESTRRSTPSWPLSAITASGNSSTSFGTGAELVPARVFSTACFHDNLLYNRAGTGNRACRGDATGINPSFLLGKGIRIRPSISPPAIKRGEDFLCRDREWIPAIQERAAYYRHSRIASRRVLPLIFPRGIGPAHARRRFHSARLGVQPCRAEEHRSRLRHRETQRRGRLRHGRGWVS